MKFGKTLRSTADPDWAQAGMFIDYHRLKVHIRKMIALNQGDAASAGAASSSAPPAAPSIAFAKAYDLFWCILKSEIDKVSEFYCARESEALAHCAALRLDRWTLPDNLADPHTVAAFLRAHDEVYANAATANASSSSASTSHSASSSFSSLSSSSSASASDDMATVVSPMLPPVPFLASSAANELPTSNAMTAVVSPLRLSSASPPFAAAQISASAQSLNHSQLLRDTVAMREFRGFFALCAAIDRLRKYSAMNYMAVIKIVKKLGTPWRICETEPLNVTLLPTYEI
jgi:hypothetical protein